MKFIKLLLVLPVVFILNFDTAFAEDNPASPPTIAGGTNAVVSPAADPQPANVEATPTAEPIPTLTIPVETVPSPVTENKEEVVTDTHLVIEAVPVPTDQHPVAVEHNMFSRIKQLAGRWEGVGAGSNGAKDKQDKVTVVYEVTAGGYAVMERIFPGTAQEMVTMYYEDKGKLTLLHFSLIGTRSLMALKPALGNSKSGEESVLDFQLADGPGFDPDVDTHMHSLKISFIDDNHMVQEWVMFEAGKPSGTYSFDLTRPPPSN